MAPECKPAMSLPGLLRARSGSDIVGLHLWTPPAKHPACHSEGKARGHYTPVDHSDSRVNVRVRPSGAPRADLSARWDHRQQRTRTAPGPHDPEGVTGRA